MKKVIYIILFVVTLLLVSSISVKATTTLKVTADTLNIRKSASTNATVLSQLSKGDICELIEEDGDWYKITYKSYTGYVSKKYVEVQQSSDDGKKEDNNTSGTNENVTEYNEVTGKTSKKTDVKILPLIGSSVIESLNKDTEITVISELNGWAYVQSSTVEGWIRSDVITNRKTTTIKLSNTSDTKQEENNTNTNTSTNTNTVDNKDNSSKNEVTDNTVENNNTTQEQYTKKTMYVKEEYVNLRKQASTSSDVLMVVGVNTKLTVVGEDGDWYKLDTSEGEAYVSKKLVSDTKVTTSRSGGARTVEETATQTAKTTQTSSNSENKTEQSTNSSEKTTETVSTESSKKGEEIVNYAKKFLGVPYVYGGADSDGFDCSGFTMYVYKKFGISMGHGAQMQSRLGKKVTADKTSSSSLKNNLQPGDLVFFLDYETMDEIGHCGIYIGDGKFIHASSGSGYCVKINSLLPGEYYNTRYCAARRVI